MYVMSCVMFVALMDGSEEDLVLYIDELINKARFGDLIFFCLFVFWQDSRAVTEYRVTDMYDSTSRRS